MKYAMQVPHFGYSFCIGGLDCVEDGDGGDTGRAELTYQPSDAMTNARAEYSRLGFGKPEIGQTYGSR